MSEWKKVKDGMPEIPCDGKTMFLKVIVFSKAKGVLEARARKLYERKRDKISCLGIIFHTFCPKCLDGDELNDVTHWKPFSEPPKREEETNG